MSLIIDGSNGLTFPNSTTQASAGQVLQVVNADYGTETSTTSTSFSDTGLTATITPKFSTSKILVLFSQQGCCKAGSDAANALQLKLLRNGSVILNVNDLGGYTNSTAVNNFGTISAFYLDSPATTSATTYKTQYAAKQSGATVYVQQFGSNSGYTRSTITLLEIAA